MIKKNRKKLLKRVNEIRKLELLKCEKDETENLLDSYNQAGIPYAIFASDIVFLLKYLHFIFLKID